MPASPAPASAPDSPTSKSSPKITRRPRKVQLRGGAPPFELSGGQGPTRDEGRVDPAREAYSLYVERAVERAVIGSLGGGFTLVEQWVSSPKRSSPQMGPSAPP